jgi:hypothetical protein
MFRARNVPLLLALDCEGRARHAREGVFDTAEPAQDLMAAVRRTAAPAALATVQAWTHATGLDRIAQRNVAGVGLACMDVGAVAAAVGEAIVQDAACSAWAGRQECAPFGGALGKPLVCACGG